MKEKLYKGSSNINQTGLFTAVPFKPGDHVAYIDGPIVVFREITPTISKKMLNWIGVSTYSWINTDKSLFRFINHSCNPNVAQITKRKVVALSNIDAGEEITMDYSLTEAEADWSIEPCNCGHKKCRVKITEIRKLPKRVYKEKKDYIPKRFREIYERTQQTV